MQYDSLCSLLYHNTVSRAFVLLYAASEVQ